MTETLGRIVLGKGSAEVPPLPSLSYPFTELENARFKEVHDKLDAINAKLDQLLSAKNTPKQPKEKKEPSFRKGISEHILNIISLRHAHDWTTYEVKKALRDNQYNYKPMQVNQALAYLFSRGVLQRIDAGVYRLRAPIA